ncbi:MAG: IS110 family transposase [Chloroflexi bacterium]|nr:IS110 family transposase [Chloroflexota bacterium]NOG76921.1 IS110 family transposase [Chloroflexota bacterium]
MGKGKRTAGMEEAHPFTGMRRVNEKAAGVDIGAVEIVVCVAGDETTQVVKAFGNYTVDLQNIGKWLKAYGVKTVAMESTGVYWIPLFEELEGQGFECLLISSRSLRRVAGRKSDIEDAQWIQTLHSYGLLESSFRPQAELIALRTLLRHRNQLVEHRSPHILHMQKALLQMNVQLSQAVSDITGVTGQTILRAIVAGERDPQALAAMRETGCKKSAEEIGRALTGSWREEHLFILKQSLEMFDFYTRQIEACDAEIERVYGMTRPDWEVGEVKPVSRRKRNSHSKNRPPNPEGIRKHLKRISGVDLSVVDGFGVSLAQTVIMEVGTDMSKFPSEKHFCSWLGLAPKHEISGGKVLKNKTLKTKNRAGQAFRMAAQSVKQADCVFGVTYRRLKARLGPAQATVATAHAIARVVYRMLKYKIEYETISVEEYEQKYQAQQLKYMSKRAAKLGYQLVPA